MKKLDNLGITISTVCLVHCIVLPVLILFFPIISLSFFLNEIYEWIFLFLSIVIGLFSLCFGYKKHKSFTSLRLLIVGFAFLIISKLFDSNSLESYHTISILCGGILIIASHIVNKKLCNSCSKCNLHEN